MAVSCHRKHTALFLFASGLAVMLLAAPAIAQTPSHPGSRVRSASSGDYAAQARVALLEQAQQAAASASTQRSQVVPAGYVPRGERVMQGRTRARSVAQEQIQGEEMPYDVQYEGEYFEGEYVEGGYSGYGGCDSCGGGCDGGCGINCGVPTRCMPVCCLPVPCFTMENFTASLGVVGFKGPLNHGYDGSFGFAYGFNWGGPALFGARYGIGMQLGAQIIQSNLSGSTFVTDDRDQFFMTAGFFRRVDCGLQGGLVWDYMHQEWGGDLDMNQVRGEVSWLTGCGREFGFLFTLSDDNEVWITDQNVNGNTTPSAFDTWYEVDTTDYYAGFYRKQFSDCNGGEGRFMAGFTQYGDGFLGADMTVPISCKWALQGSFAYIIADGDRNADGRYDDESWNVGVRLVWYPKCNARGSCGSGGYYRPLFPVADNGIMHFDTRNQGSMNP